MSWTHFLIVLLRKSIQEAKGIRGGQEMSWIHFLIVVLRQSIQQAGEGDRRGQEISWSHFLIVSLRKSIQEAEGAEGGGQERICVFSPCFIKKINTGKQVRSGSACISLLFY